jgi:hypothetical protein
VPLGHDSDDVVEIGDPAPAAAEVVAGFVASYAADVAAARGLPADSAPAWWPEGAWGGYRQDTVLGVLMHLFADNAAHAGQLSIVRELLTAASGTTRSGRRVPEPLGDQAASGSWESSVRWRPSPPAWATEAASANSTPRSSATRATSAGQRRDAPRLRASKPLPVGST